IEPGGDPLLEALALRRLGEQLRRTANVLGARAPAPAQRRWDELVDAIHAQGEALDLGEDQAAWPDAFRRLDGALTRAIAAARTLGLEGCDFADEVRAVFAQLGATATQDPDAAPA
ncbi:MAG TPA: hypothetical protein VN238_15560, partial [Solirubrobacteraceae bacterium]|nr:hypothetical protein [Solirubrobacteraceae bacterium]